MKNYLVISLIFFLLIVFGNLYVFRIEQNNITNYYKIAYDISFNFIKAENTAKQFQNILKIMKEHNKTNREFVTVIMKEILINEPELFGIWTVWEPNKFDNKDKLFINQLGHDNTGRFIPYWNRGKNEYYFEPCVDFDRKDERGDYYNIPKNTRKSFITKPITYKIAGKDITVVSFCYPIIINNEFLGVAGVDLSLDYLQNMIDKIHDDKSNIYSFIITQQGIIAAYPNKDFIGVSLYELNKTLKKYELFFNNGSEFSTNISENPTKIKEFVYHYIPVKLENTYWFISIAMPQDMTYQIYEIIYNNIYNIIVVLFYFIFLLYYNLKFDKR